MKSKTKIITKCKLEPSVKAKWVAALRSGKYKQGTGKLYESRTQNYCCLGVACRLHNIDLDELDISLPADLKTKDKNKLPNFFRQNKCFDDAAPNDDSEFIINKLAKFNDHGLSFKWIASYIERYL